ncbi:50S ribosomal protein L9 [Heliorestis acidaminivorans]|uniref:Large ribosomal subunit protein bL9 n=1 Tax=Heliorestis acidaminivorans TaxID=553427 RepID=A0A6I0EUJ1_9FIRM|nr:50S ribosomal protein L9 [Heliorestis acidaminivorans]KAB2953864.1 50S ribosomal protein L9 [Heliorestis acidaminivorans]
MKVILLEDVKKLGKKGDVLEVKEGYGRNFLISRGLAVEANKGNMNNLERQKANEEKRKEQELQAAKDLGQKLKGITVKIKAKSGEGGRLFGAVTNKEIAEILEKDKRIKIDKRKLELKQPIKALGLYTINVKIHPAVAEELKVEVVSE